MPLPPGTAVTRVEKRSGNRLIIKAVVPASFKVVLRFLQQRLPDAGYPLSAGEVEPFDAESNFAGHGRVGRWTLRDGLDCVGTSELAVLVGEPP